jgi:hypothetical protein
MKNIYVKRGVDQALARQVVEQLMAKDALMAHARDELGISEITTARQAALTSAATFAVGAAMPLLMVSPASALVLIVSAASLGFLALRRDRSQSRWRESPARHRASDILGRAGHGSDCGHWRNVRDGGLNWSRLERGHGYLFSSHAAGVTNISSALESKRLDLLGEIIPKAARVAALINPDNPNAEVEEKDLRSAANALGRTILIVHASNEAGLDQAFITVMQAGIYALVVVLDPFLRIQRDRLVELAAQHKLPTIYSDRQFAFAGGMMSYGANISTLHRQAGIYAGRILNGEKPSNLPGGSAKRDPANN